MKQNLSCDIFQLSFQEKNGLKSKKYQNKKKLFNSEVAVLKIEKQIIFKAYVVTLYSRMCLKRYSQLPTRDIYVRCLIHQLLEF